MPSLRHLQENNVIVLFLPSHTSIWSQPNDCRANNIFHMKIENAIQTRRVASSRADIGYYNEAIITGWDAFVEEQHRDLVTKVSRKSV